jgi:hypothetical protein
VLVTGGSNGSNFLTSCELYDPGAGTWMATGSLATERGIHTATLLPSGKILVTGGLTDVTSSVSCELYDYTTGTWTTTDSLITGRFFHTATLLSSGTVLATGGYDGNGDTLATCELHGHRAVVTIILPTSNASWTTTLTNLPIAGTAEHPLGILAVSYQLSGATSGAGTAAGTTSWTFTPTLNPGITTIIVTAETTDGYLSTDSLAVTVNTPPAGSPTIVISSPTTGDSWLSAGGGVTISGTTSSSATVTSVSYMLSGATSGSGSATGTTSWAFSPTLNPGLTIVTMTALDNYGRTGQDAITITRDVADPVILISSPDSSGIHLVGTTRISVTGSTTDDGGITSVTYQMTGATSGSGTVTGTTSWSLLTPSLKRGITTVTFTAHDVAGRTSVVALDLLYPTTSEVGTGNASGSCGSGSGLAAMLGLVFLVLVGFRRHLGSAAE